MDSAVLQNIPDPNWRHPAAFCDRNEIDDQPPRGRCSPSAVGTLLRYCIPAELGDAWPRITLYRVAVVSKALSTPGLGERPTEILARQLGTTVETLEADIARTRTLGQLDRGSRFDPALRDTQRQLWKSRAGGTTD